MGYQEAFIVARRRLVRVWGTSLQVKETDLGEEGTRM